MPVLEANEVVDLVMKELWPAFTKERERLDIIDRWMRWDHDKPHTPRRATPEYKELGARAQTPWGDFLVSSLARGMFIEGYRAADAEGNAKPWAIWQANGFDARQVPLNRAVVGYGVAYGLALPGTLAMTKQPMPTLRGMSPRQMIALYEDPAVDEWPYVAMRVAYIKGKAELRIYDDVAEHTVQCSLSGRSINGAPTYTEAKEHHAGVCPVVRFTDRFDLEGRIAGEIEPYISVLARLDQTTMDRLVVQRFSSWVVRTVAGMAKPANDQEEAAAKMVLRMGDLLISDSAETKFGSLPATPLDGFIKAHEADQQTLAAVSASPAHELLGSIANLSAEALAAARAPQTAKVDEIQHVCGESYERFLRLGAHIMGDDESAADFASQVRWKDTSIRSLAQAADALGKLATMLEVPVELLWEKIPGFTDTDVEAAKALLTKGDSITAVLRDIATAQKAPSAVPAPAAA